MERLRRYRSDRDLGRCGVYDGAGGYRSQWYQGLEAGMEWHRLCLEGVSSPRVRVYAADETPEEWDSGRKPVMEREAGDLLLYGIRGRWLCFTVAPAEELQGYSLSFPGRCIDEGLPDVMRGDDTLRRFLGVYQSAYMDTNVLAARFPGRLDARAGGALAELKYWLGAAPWMRDAPCTPELLSAAPLLNRLRGTRRGLELLLRAVGVRGELVEHFQWRDRAVSAQEQEDCARLYGGERGVTLLMSEDTPEAVMRFLDGALEDFIPLGVVWSVVRLQAGAPMDGHSYLDANAELSEPPPPALDETELDELILE